MYKRQPASRAPAAVSPADALLARLRSAAMGGIATLKSEYDLEEQTGDVVVLDTVWAAHSKALKAAAASADKAATERTRAASKAREGVPA